MKTDRTYHHIDIFTAQTPKPGKTVCGDVVVHERSADATTVILCDGMGSGIQARVAAQMYASRLKAMIDQGASLREAFSSVVASAGKARTGKGLYAAMCAGRVLNDGSVTVLNFECPPPIVVSNRGAAVVPQRQLGLGCGIVGESEWRLAPRESIILMSDGITQSGAGVPGRKSWGIDGAASYIRLLRGEGTGPALMAERLAAEACRRSEGTVGDDTTAVVLASRSGRTLNLLSGPPADRGNDRAAIESFMNASGVKAICGSTTAEIASRVTARTLNRTGQLTEFTPPSYTMEGIDLVAEGAVTLTQVYNILDEKPENVRGESAVAQLCKLFHAADRICFWTGGAVNPGHEDLAFRRMGILSRSVIIPLIAEKLTKAGKLVVIKNL